MLNLRRTLKNPPAELCMADGGDVSPFSLRGMYNKFTTPAPPQTMTQKFAAQDAAQDAARAPAPVAAPPVAAPAQGISGYVGNPALDTRMKAAGLRDGGDLRTGAGGNVPGSGSGDKIPAKYEPGEFVVSNAMLDAAPGLRGQLRDLRGNVLAAQGKTVAEADAGAMGYDTGPQGDDHEAVRDQGSVARVPGRNGGGRAGAHAEGDEAGDRNPESGGAAGRHPGLRVSALRAVEGYEFPGRSLVPIPGTGDNGYRPNFTTGSQPAAPAPYTRSPEAFGRDAANRVKAIGAGLGKIYNLPPVPFVQKGISAAAALSNANDAVNSAQTGNYAGALDSGLSSAANAAGAFALRGAGGAGLAYTAGHYAGGKLYDRMSPETQDSIGSAINTGVRGFGKLIGQDFGVEPPQANTPQAPANDARPAINPVAPTATFSAGDATMPGQDPGRFTLPSAPALRDPPGVPLSGAPGVFKSVQGGKTSYSNVPGDQAAGPGVSVVPGMSRDQIDRALTNPNGSRWTEADNAIMAANQRDGVDPYRGTSRGAASNEGNQGPTVDPQMLRLAQSPLGTPGRAFAQKQVGDMQAQAATLRGQQMVSADNRLVHTMQNQTALRGQDITERDNLRNNTTSLTNSAATNKLGVFNAQREQGNSDRTFKAGRDDAGFTHSQTEIATRAKAQDDLHKEIAGYLPSLDGKPDLDGAARYSVAMNADLDTKMRSLAQDAKAGKAGAAAALQDLQTNGAAALGTTYKRNFINGMKAKDLADQYSSGALNPFGGRAVISDAPVTSLRKTGDGFLGFGGEYTSNRGDKIPARAVEGDGSQFGGKTRTDLRSLIRN